MTVQFRAGCHNVDDDTQIWLPGDSTRRYTARQLRALGHTEYELRILTTPIIDLDHDQLTAFELELGRRIGATATIVKFDANTGLGRYQTVLVTGETVTRPFTASADAILTPTFAPSVNAGGPNKGKEVTGKFAAPDTYKKALERRAAEATPEQKADDDFKALRTAEFAAEARRRDEHIAAHPRLTTAEAKTYPPPDAYAPDLQKLRERDARALAAKEIS